MMKMLPIFIIFFCFKAHSGCSSPSGVAGEFRWMSPVMKWCDNANWIDITVGGSIGGGYQAGRFAYMNSMPGYWYYDNGTQTFSVRGVMLESCAGTTESTIQYESTRNLLKFCSSDDKWYKLGTGAVGPLCASSGFPYNGYCYYASNTSQGCNTRCSQLGGSTNLTGTHSIGPSGNDAACKAVLEGLLLGAVGSNVTMQGAVAYGCGLAGGTRVRGSDGGMFTYEYVSGSFRNACACNL